jgi:hypothetical protein
MRFRELFWFSKREFTINPFLYAGLLFLLIFALTAIGMTVETFSRSVEAFYDYVNRIGNNTFVCELPGLHLDRRDLIDDIDFSEIYAEKEGWVEPVLFTGERRIGEEGLYVELLYPRKGIDIRTTDGEGFNYTNDDNDVVWISEEIAEAYDLSVGDEIIQKITKDDSEIKYKVIGLYHPKDADPDIVFALDTYYINMLEHGEFVNHHVVGTLTESRSYIGVRKTLRDRNIVVRCEYDDVFDFLAIADIIIYILSAVTALFGVWMFNNALGIMIKRRMVYLLKLRMIGIRSFSLLKIFCCTTAVTVVISFVISRVIVFAFTGYISGLIQKFYQIGIASKGSYKGFIVTLIACVTVYLFGVLKLKSAIGKANLSQALEGSRA